MRRVSRDLYSSYKWHFSCVLICVCLLCRVAEGLKRMSVGILYLGIFAVLDPWFSANILLSDEYQVCKCKNMLS